MSDYHYGRIPADVAECTEQLLKGNADRIDSAYIVAVGASIGANAAIMLSEEMPYLRKAVALSPGEDYRGMKPMRAFERFSGQTLLITGQSDSYSYKTVNAMVKIKMRDWLLKIYPSGEHGTTLLNNDTRVMDFVVSWIFQPVEQAGGTESEAGE
jgi:hypothetical protein